VFFPLALNCFKIVFDTVPLNVSIKLTHLCVDCPKNRTITSIWGATGIMAECNIKSNMRTWDFQSRVKQSFKKVLNILVFTITDKKNPS
jgi:hypothetical protein